MGKHCAARRRGTCSPPASAPPPVTYPPAPTIYDEGGGLLTTDTVPWPGLDQIEFWGSDSEDGTYLLDATLIYEDMPFAATEYAWYKARFTDGTLFSEFGNKLAI
jgi:hypothetical protein